MKLGSFLYLSSNKEGIKFNTLVESLLIYIFQKSTTTKLVFNNGMCHIFITLSYDLGGSTNFPTSCLHRNKYNR